MDIHKAVYDALLRVLESVNSDVCERVKAAVEEEPARYGLNPGLYGRQFMFLVCMDEGSRIEETLGDPRVIYAVAEAANPKL